jgi:DNA-binding CsgD family transcriptional regulator
MLTGKARTTSDDPVRAPAPIGKKMLSHETLTDRIYEAAVIPELWPSVLASFAELSSSIGSVLIARSDSGLRMVASDPDFEKEAQEYFLTFSTHNERTLRLLRASRQEFVSDQDVFTLDQLLVEPIFRDYLIPRGFGRGVATVVPIPTGEQIILHCEGPFSPDPYDARTKESLNLLRPHLARAAMVGARLAYEAVKSSADLLDRLGMPAVAVSSQRKIVVANALFDSQAGDWVLSSQNGITLRDPIATEFLGRALGTVRQQETIRSIPLRLEAGPAIIHVIPIRRSAADIFNNCAALLVFMRPRSDSAVEASLLLALFDLTAAEADVANAIALGKSIADIASARQTSLETVRNQLKRVLVKTGCHRQADLQALLRQLAGPAR